MRTTDNSSKAVGIALVIAGLLLVATSAVCFVSAYNEPIEAAEESRGESDGTLDAGTQVQTAFFAIAGAANVGAGAWIIAVRKKAVQAPYVVAAAGSAILIDLYIASRTVSLPVVGMQDDVGAADIASKVLQGATISLAAYAISVCRKAEGELKSRLA